MSYTANIRMDAVCNYLNLETRNATDMSIPCINEAKDVAIHDFKNNNILLLYDNMRKFMYWFQ